MSPLEEAQNILSQRKEWFSKQAKVCDERLSVLGRMDPDSPDLEYISKVIRVEDD